MNKIERELTEINDKVDTLYQMVESLTIQITSLSLEKQRENSPPAIPPQTNLTQANFTQTNLKSNIDYRRDFASQQPELPLIQHKDILQDNTDTWQRHQELNIELGISPEIQLRRLTAQLTAAYNRIAALEDQLLNYHEIINS